MTDKDPYRILGVSRSASQDEIKRAFRRLAKEHHPDRNPDDQSAVERFKEVRAAYEVLGDPQRRQQYDRFGAGGPRPNVGSWSSGNASFDDMGFGVSGFGDLSSIFEQFFRKSGPARQVHRARRSQPRRGADIEHIIEISLEEAARGVERELVLTAGGNGAAQQRITFRVPPGVSDGQRIRLRGQGQPGSGARGDLIVRCQVRPHPYFRRDGNNIILDLPLSFAEAARGTQIEIPTLEGRSTLTVPPGTSGGSKLRLRGLGLPSSKGGQRGDQYAVVRIQVPRGLTARAQDILEELDQELKQNPRAGLTWT